MNLDIDIEKILAYSRENKARWRYEKVNQKNVESIQAYGLDFESPFSAIKLYRCYYGVETLLLCVFVLMEGNINIVSSYDLRNPDLLQKLWQRGSAIADAERHINYEENTKYSAQCPLYPYLRMEAARRQKYKKELLCTAFYGVAILCFFFACIFSIVYGEHNSYEWYIDAAMYSFIIGALLYGINQQIKSLRMLRHSIQDYVKELQLFLSWAEMHRENEQKDKKSNSKKQ